MTPNDVAALFTRPDGTYHFARWGRPIVPVVFGTDDATLAVVKAATEVVVSMSGHKMAEMDPEFGANLMLFFVRDWAELPRVKGLDALVPGLGALAVKQAAARESRNPRTGAKLTVPARKKVKFTESSEIKSLAATYKVAA